MTNALTFSRAAPTNFTMELAIWQIFTNAALHYLYRHYCTI